MTPSVRSMISPVLTLMNWCHNLSCHNDATSSDSAKITNRTCCDLRVKISSHRGESWTRELWISELSFSGLLLQSAGGCLLWQRPGHEESVNGSAFILSEFFFFFGGVLFVLQISSLGLGTPARTSWPPYSQSRGSNWLSFEQYSYQLCSVERDQGGRGVVGLVGWVGKQYNNQIQKNGNRSFYDDDQIL